MKVTAYSGSIGINNKVVSHRLKYNPETGVGAFEDAVDFLIDSTGAASSLRGNVEITDGAFHSVFPGRDWGLAAMDRASDTAVYQVHVADSSNITLNGILSGLTKGARIDFCRVNNNVFMTNTYMTGMINPNGTVVPWQNNVWPDSSSIKGFIAPPSIGIEKLCYNAGRMYFSMSDQGGRHSLNYTEFGHLGLYDPATNGEQFASKPLVIAPAVDGLYVSDREAIYFLAGLNPHKWQRRQVTDYPAKEWGKFHGTVDPSFFGFELSTPSSILATDNGPLICMPGGRVENLIDKNITMPSCPSVGAVSVFDETLIIQCFE